MTALELVKKLLNAPLDAKVRIDGKLIMLVYVNESGEERVIFIQPE